MNHFHSRVAALLLATLFLAAAGAVSFIALFRGVQVFADEPESTTSSASSSSPTPTPSPTPGSSSVTRPVNALPPTPRATKTDDTIRIISIKREGGNGGPISKLTGTMSNLKVEFEVTTSQAGPSGAVFKSGSFSQGTFSKVKEGTLSGGNYTHTFTMTGCTYDGSKMDPTITITYGNSTADNTGEGTVDLSSFLSSAGDEYSIQSYAFYTATNASQGEPIPLRELKNGAYIKELVITIRDSGFSADDYKEAVGSMTAALNYSTFSPRSNSLISFSPEAVQLSDGTSYQITFSELTYTGKTNTLELTVGYPQKWGLERRTFKETLPEGEIYTPPEHTSNNDDDDKSSSSRVEIAPPTPNIIVTEYDYGGEPVRAAGDARLKITFKNTSQRLPIDNIVLKLTMPEALTLTSSSNTFYFDKMSKQQEETVEIGFSVKPSAEAISHPIKLAFTFESVIMDERKSFTSEQEISIPVTQLNRFTLNPVEVPAEIYIGDSTSVTAEFVNKGKATIYNVTAFIEGEGLSQPGQIQFIGNMDSGKQEEADFMLDALEPGAISGEIVVTYEDANMNVSEVRTPFTTQAISFDSNQGMDEGTDAMRPMEPPEETPAWYVGIPPWYWTVGGTVMLIVTAFVLKLCISARKKKLEAENEDF